MTEAIAPTLAPEPSPSPAGLSHAEFDSVEDKGAYAQVKKPDGDGSHWVKRSDLPPDVPSSTSQARPTWAPESTWDANTGLNHEAFGQWYAEQVQPALDRHAAEQARKAALPTPDKYEVKVSPALKLPDNVQPALNVDEPFWRDAKGWAHKHGLSQQAFSEGIDLIAGRDTLTRSQVERARNAEIGKLGPAAQSRMQAIENFYKDTLGDDGARLLMARVWTAGDVTLHEKLVARFATQRGNSVPREEPGISEEAWSKLDAGERLQYARLHSNGGR
jgi:hypothetical protein